MGRLRLCCLQPSCLPCLSCRLPNSARAQYQAHTCILDIFTIHGNKSCTVAWSTTQPPWPLSTLPPLISDHNIYPLTPPPHCACNPLHLSFLLPAQSRPLSTCRKNFQFCSKSRILSKRPKKLQPRHLKKLQPHSQPKAAFKSMGSFQRARI